MNNNITEFHQYLLLAIVVLLIISYVSIRYRLVKSGYMELEDLKKNGECTCSNKTFIMHSNVDGNSDGIKTRSLSYECLACGTTHGTSIMISTEDTRMNKYSEDNMRKAGLIILKEQHD